MTDHRAIPSWPTNVAGSRSAKCATCDQPITRERVGQEWRHAKA